MNDLTIIFYSANHISDYFMGNVVKQLKQAAGDIPIISVTHKPMDLGGNICVGDVGRSSYNIYKQILIGAKIAKTEYVATAEDDVLYPKNYFQYRPEKGVFAYDTNKWSIFTWVKPPFLSHRQRRTMTNCIAHREDMIKTLEERFEKYPDKDNFPEHIWGEPGRYEHRLKITPVKNERYLSYRPSIVYSTEEALGFGNLGRKKRHSLIRATALPYWGSAESLLALYEH